MKNYAKLNETNSRYLVITFFSFLSFYDFQACLEGSLPRCLWHGLWLQWLLNEFSQKLIFTTMKCFVLFLFSYNKRMEFIVFNFIFTSVLFTETGEWNNFSQKCGITWSCAMSYWETWHGCLFKMSAVKTFQKKSENRKKS